MGDSTLSALDSVDITDSNLISSTVAEADFAEWLGGATTYAADDKVISLTTHRIYISLQAGNTNHDPTDIANRTGTAPWWLDLGPTNRWKMLDGETSSQTTDASPLTYVFEPGFINGLYAGSLIGDEVVVTVKDAPGGNVVYTNTITLENSQPPDYYEYFFTGFQQQPDLLLDDIPPYELCEVTFTLTAVSGNVSCGMLRIGDLRPIGTTEAGASAEPKTYSYIAIDEFGNNVIQRRKSAKDMKLRAKVEIGYANTALEIINSMLDVPVLWSATPLATHSGLRVLGLGSGKLVYEDSDFAYFDISIKGLI